MINKRKCPIHRFDTICEWKGEVLQCSKCGGFVEGLKELGDSFVYVRKTPNSIAYTILSNGDMVDELWDNYEMETEKDALFTTKGFSLVDVEKEFRELMDDSGANETCTNLLWDWLMVHFVCPDEIRRQLELTLLTQEKLENEGNSPRDWYELLRAFISNNLIKSRNNEHAKKD